MTITTFHHHLHEKSKGGYFMEVNNKVFFGWEQISFVERDDLTNEITFSEKTLSFFKGAFSAYVENVEEIRRSLYHEDAQQEFLVNRLYIFHITLGEYGHVDYLCTYSEKQGKEKSFGKQILEISKIADVPWHIAKIAKDLDLEEAQKVLCSIREIAKSITITGMQQLFLRKKDLQLRNYVLQCIFEKKDQKLWLKIREPILTNENNSRYLAYYILVKGEIESDINAHCDLPHASTPTTEAEIFNHNMNLRALKSGVGIRIALCTANIADNSTAVMFLKRMRDYISDNKVIKREDYLLCDEDDYYRNSMLRHYFGEEIWSVIGSVLEKKRVCSLSIGNYVYRNRRRGLGL